MRVKVIGGSILLLTGIFFVWIYLQQNHSLPVKTNNSQGVINATIPTQAPAVESNQIIEIVPSTTPLPPTIAPTATPSNTPVPQYTPVFVPMHTPIPTVVNDTEPPTIASISYPWGPNFGERATDTFCFLVTSKDNVLSAATDFSYRFKIDGNEYGGWEHNPYPCFSRPSAGTHIFTVQSKDVTGNISNSASRDFTVVNPTSP